MRLRSLRRRLSLRSGPIGKKHCQPTLHPLLLGLTGIRNWVGADKKRHVHQELQEDKREVPAEPLEKKAVAEVWANW